MVKAASVVWGALCLLLILASPGWSVEVGGALPEFEVQTLDGVVVSRASLEGQPALLVFWNTWCPECQRELPRINQLAETFGPKGLAVLAINTAINDSEARARVFWQKRGFTFPTGFDHSFELGQAFRVRGVPTVFLFDSQGIARYKGAKPPEDMEELFPSLLARERP